MAILVGLCAVLKNRKVEDHSDFILGPVSLKEYKDTVAELNGSRTNRVFEFFKVTAPERVGFAKHCEAAERKAAALAAVGADTAETATSPHASGAPSKKTMKRTAPAAAAMAAAEGKARKKQGAHPTSSPPTAKKTWFVDLDTGDVATVIAVVPLRAAAPLGSGGGKTGGPLLVPLSPKEKDSDDDSDIRVVSSVVDTPRDRSPLPSDTNPLAMKACPAQCSAVRQVHHWRTLANLPLHRPRAPKRTILVPKLRRKMSPRAATTM
jgi:hypothetical protein